MPKNSNRSRSLQPTTGNTETVTQERPAHIDNGNDARGATTARGNQTQTQPEPSPAIVALGDQEISDKVVNLRQRGPLAMRRHLLSETGAAKHRILGETKQRLAEAADLFNLGGEKAREGKIIADKAAVSLYQARANGVLSADELSTLLGDTFGWKAKKGDKERPVKGGDPDASKTPFGQGEAIRKRVVRAVQAYEYVHDVDASKFFDGLPVDTVADVLQRVETGSLSIWSAYDTMGEIKRDAATKINPAFDPVRVAKFVEALREPNAAQIFADSPSLQDAYLALHDMIVEIDREAAPLIKAAAAA
jgi:hypothetical protein